MANETFGSNPQHFKYAWFNLKAALRTKQKWDTTDIEQAIGNAELIAMEAAKTDKGE